MYSRLCASQSRPRLLHGDLHHYNVLPDSERGWLAIDPKGWAVEDGFVVGPDNAWITLAGNIRPMLKGAVDAC